MQRNYEFDMEDQDREVTALNQELQRIRGQMMNTVQQQEMLQNTLNKVDSEQRQDGKESLLTVLDQLREETRYYGISSRDPKQTAPISSSPWKILRCPRRAPQRKCESSRWN